MFTKILFKLHRISGWVLLVLTILYLVSGYGLTKQIIPYSLAIKLHTQILEIPFLVFLILHCLFPLVNFLKKKIKRK